MRPYSNDLRQRILTVVERGEYSLRFIARLFSVSLSFIVRLLQRWRAGTVAPLPHGGGRRPALDDAAVQRLLALVAKKPDATLAELRDELGVPCHPSTIFRMLVKQRITRKKKTLHAAERDDPRVQAERAAFDRRLADVPAERLVFVDETGATTGMTRTHGRSPCGERVHAAAPGRWQTVTLIGGLRSNRVLPSLALVGAADTPAFHAYVKHFLIPHLRPADVVLWDNLKIHKDPAIVADILKAGARLEPLPIYSPDKSPIEEMFSKLKNQLRNLAARTTDTVMAAMGQALNNVTPSNIAGWFRDRCQYAMQ